MPDAASYFAVFTPRSRRVADVARVLEALVEPSRGESANLGFDLHRIVGEPARFAVLERYVSPDGFVEHWRQPHMMAFLDQAEELLSCPPEILPLEAVGGAPV